MGVQRRPTSSSGAFAALVLNLAVFAAVGTSGAKAGGDAASNDECLALGFSESLECDTCEKLQQYVTDSKLYLECRECCRVVANDELLYDEAKLQICD